MEYPYRIPIGIFYILLTTVLIVPYIFYVIVIVTNKKLIKMSCYKILVLIGIAENVQVLMLGLVPAVFSFLEVDGTSFTGKVFGATLDFSWYTAELAIPILALNRVLALASGHYNEFLFKPPRVYAWMLACVLYGFVYFCILLSPKADLLFYSDTYLWSNGNTTAALEFTLNCMVNDVILLCLTVVFNAASVYSFWRLKQKASNQQFSAEEKRALVPTVVVGVTLAINDLYFYLMPTISDDYWVLFFSNVQWLVLVGINGVLNLLLNRTVRTHAAKLLGMGDTNKVFIIASNKRSTAVTSQSQK